MAKAPKPITGTNYFKFHCPVYGTVRSFEEAKQLCIDHSMGRRNHSAMAHAILRASKDPILHMLHEERLAGRPIYFTEDPDAEPGYPSDAVLERIAPLLILDSFMQGCTDEERTQLIALNESAVPVGTRVSGSALKPKRKMGKTTASDKPKAVRTPREAGKPSAAGRFRELILAGGKSDDEIFAAVKAEFNLDDNRRSYVDWYRKDLKKQGKL